MGNGEFLHLTISSILKLLKSKKIVIFFWKCKKSISTAAIEWAFNIRAVRKSYIRNVLSISNEGPRRHTKPKKFFFYDE